MKAILRFLPIVLVAACAVPAAQGGFTDRVRAYMAENGMDPDEAIESGAVAIFIEADDSDGKIFWKKSLSVPKPTADMLPAENEAVGILSAKSSEKITEKQLKKPKKLQDSENDMIEFLRDEGAIGKNATSAGIDEIDALFESWDKAESDENGDEIASKYAKYMRLLRSVERNGGSETDVNWHGK